MAKAMGLGGIFFRARDPQALAQWYVTHLGLAVDPAYGGVRFASKVGQLAGNHFLTLTSNLENLYPLGRKCLWEGAQPIRFELG